MSQIHEVPVLPFRHDTDEEILKDPFGRWDRLRNAHTIFKSDQADHGVIFLMGYAEQHAALRDPKDILQPKRQPGVSHRGTGWS